MFGLSPSELRILKPLTTPRKIQHFLNQIPINFEIKGETCLSPRKVLQQNRAHCIEGAMLAALALRLQGYPPLLVDLTATRNDLDHVIAVFRQHGHWGAISKTNHAVLRYRDPIYRTIRELVLSFFHEYFDTKGRKTLRSYSLPVDLTQFDSKGWMTTEKEVWPIAEHLVDVPHFSLLTRKQIAVLKQSDPIEIEVGNKTEWGHRKGKIFRKSLLSTT